MVQSLSRGVAGVASPSDSHRPRTRSGEALGGGVGRVTTTTLDAPAGWREEDGALAEASGGPRSESGVVTVRE